MVSSGGRNTSLRSGGCVVIVSPREEGPGPPGPIGQASAVYGATCPGLVHLGGGTRSRGIRTSANNWARGYKTYRRGEAVGFVPALDPLTVRQISNRYLSEEERIDIADLRCAGLSIRGIAAKLGRAPSTISGVAPQQPPRRPVPAVCSTTLGRHAPSTSASPPHRDQP